MRAASIVSPLRVCVSPYSTTTSCCATSLSTSSAAPSAVGTLTFHRTSAVVIVSPLLCVCVLNCCETSPLAHNIQRRNAPQRRHTKCRDDRYWPETHRYRRQG